MCSLSATGCNTRDAFRSGPRGLVTRPGSKDPCGAPLASVPRLQNGSRHRSGPHRGRTYWPRRRRRPDSHVRVRLAAGLTGTDASTQNDVRRAGGGGDLWTLLGRTPCASAGRGRSRRRQWRRSEFAGQRQSWTLVGLTCRRCRTHVSMRSRPPSAVLPKT